ncbi:unnamed protein product [Calicophoron daubneyi]|uniref:Ubiquitin carboxyl-terminal hydrolase n=1 Tax=Calicophoron daubneyi TaxID=300641 RepID=A0AAV2TS66_CALDB
MRIVLMGRKTRNRGGPKRFTGTEVSSSKVSNEVEKPAKSGKSFISAPKGLHNLGNTCYLNSSIQCLSRSPWLLDLLRSSQVKSATLKRPVNDSFSTLDVNLPTMKAPVTAQFTCLSSQLSAEHSGAVNSFALNAAKLRESVLERYPRFSGFGQQDSHEFLRAILDCMKQEELLRWKKAILDKLQLDLKSVSPDDRQLVRAWGRAASIATFVDRLFGGVLVSSLQCCDCGTIRTTFEPFLDLSLPIIDAKMKPERNHCTKYEGKSKQELKRDRKKKHQKSKKNWRKFRNELGDEGLEGPPISDSLNGAAEANEADTACVESEGADDNGIPTTGKEDCADQLAEDNPTDGQNSLRNADRNSVPRGASTCSSNGNCADVEDLDEESTHQTEPNYSEADNASTVNGLGVAPSSLSFLAEQLEGLQLDRSEMEPFGTEELMQALRLSQVPLRTTTDQGSKEDEQIGGNSSVTTIYSCLKRFTAPEKLIDSNRIACSKCSGLESTGGGDSMTGNNSDVDKLQQKCVLKDAIRRDLILNPPPLLTIHLKRFQHQGIHLQKCQKVVSFPVILDLSPFCSALSLSSSESVMYRLYGVVEHTGRMTGGHYVAYVATSNTQDQNAESQSPSAHFQAFVDNFIGRLDHPPKWPMNSRDLVLRLRRCDRTQLLKSLSDASKVVDHIDCSPNLEDNVCLGREQSLFGEERRQSGEDSSDSPLSAEKKLDTRQWFLCSDAHVSRVSIDTVLKCQPYLLFYERILI